MLLDRVVRIPAAQDLRQGAEQEEDIFKVVTCPVGYANHYRHIGRRPNCQLEWRGEGKALGEHSLVLVTTVEVKQGKELLYDYGVSHAVGRKLRSGPKKRQGAAAVAPPHKRARAKAKGCGLSKGVEI